MVHQERIQVIIETIQKGMNKIPAYANAYKQLGVGMRQVDGNLQMFNQSTGKIMNTQKANELATQNMHKKYDGFFKSMRMSMPMFQLFTETGMKMNTFGGKFGMTLRNLTAGAKGFRMELLSVMFFGQMLTKTFTSLLRPALEMFGIFDIFRIMLQVVFLPIVEMIFPVIMQVMEWFMNLSDGTKKLIGWLVLGGLAFGGILSAIGMFGLGIGGIISLISNVTEIFENLFGSTVGGAVNILMLGGSMGMLAKATTFIGDLIEPVWGKLMTKFDEMGINIPSILDSIGIKVEEGETIWDSFKKSVQKSIKGVLTDLGFSEEEIDTWTSDISNFMDDMKDTFNDTTTSISGLATSLGELAEDISDMMPTIKTIVGWLTTLVDKITDAINWYNDMNQTFSSGEAWLESASGSSTPLAPVANMILGKTGGGGGGTAGDFMWRPGSAPMKFSGQDTIIGTKGGMPGGVTINQTLNINVANADEMQRMIKSNNSDLVNDIQRLTKGAI